MFKSAKRRKSSANLLKLMTIETYFAFGKKDFPSLFILILKTGTKFLICAFIVLIHKVFNCLIGISRETLLN
jgi:hypothetical protein